MKTMTSVFVGILIGAAAIAGAQQKTKGGYIVERDAEVAKNEPGTHHGGGQTVGYSFFAKVPKMPFVFRKRALKPGSGIGYHEQKEDEVYYVLSGKGVMTLDDKPVDVGPGTAILTRPGSSHGLKQVGSDDLVILIAYEVKSMVSAR
jgi:mannose-6-phosphate isomerase-like protein (cupin superfamily)